MSFQNRGFWMGNNEECFNDPEKAYDNSSGIGQKHTQQWFVDVMEPNSLPYKKPTVETSSGGPISGVPNANISWENPSSFQSVGGQFTDRLFAPEPAKSINFGGSNFQPFNTWNLNIGTNGFDEQLGNDFSIASGTRGIEEQFENKSSIILGKECIEGQFGNDSSVTLSMDRTTEDYGGIRNVKINQVKDFDDSMFEPMSPTFNWGDSSTISFSDFQEKPEIGRFMSSYDLFMSQFSSQVQPLEASKENELVNSNADVVASASSLGNPAPIVPNFTFEPNLPKNFPPNNFPSNVRSLLTTGILDGVDVKYISWLNESELHGVIKGPGYLCGCKSCHYSKILNAYELERHAGCKTKHPNNHIFFGNGKTVYAAVQELKSLPQEMLFEAIQTVTGSEINQTAFRIWKDSYEAAIRELERIYGNDNNDNGGF